MKALVTGAGSYTASHLIPFLQKKGVSVEAWSSTNHKNMNGHQPNWNDPTKLSRLLAQIRPDYIFHLAGSRNLDTLSVNFSLCDQLIQAMLSSQVLVPTLIVGSAAEYGRVSTDQLPILESHALNPVSDYGETKKKQTLIALKAAKQGVPIVVARVFNIIGPKMPATFVLGKFLEQLSAISKGAPGPITMGPLNSIRDFIDVDDCVSIFWKLLNNKAAHGQVINVCRGAPVKTSTLLSEIQALVGDHTPIHNNGSEQAVTDISYGNNDRLIGLLGGFSFTSLNATLEKILKQ